MQDRLILNRYRPITEAGTGGFATVQLAWDTRIQRRVAIKSIILSEQDFAQSAAPAVPDPDFPDNYPTQTFETLPGLKEARTAAMLNDPTIVGVYDFEIEGSTAYLIMEYVDGLTLEKLLETHGSVLSPNAIAAIFASIAHALKIAHDNQVLHLDIKPDNILINRQGKVKVSDFGLSTLSNAAGYSAAKGGTIGYMPLEQMRQESLDARCDEWALASVTYEMISGKNPFLAPDLDQAEGAILNAELILPSLCIEGLAPGIDDVLFFALDPDRQERYESVTDFAEELLRFLGDPQRGHRELAAIIGDACEDFEDEEGEGVLNVNYFARLSKRSKGVLARVWGGLSTAFLGFIALNSIPQVDGVTSPVFWIALALILLATVFRPHLGALLSLFTLSFALFVNEAIVLGLVFLAAAASWWFFVGRKGNSEANTALLPILLGSFSFNQMSPLLTGFFLRRKETLVNTGFIFVLSVVLAGFGSQSLFGWNVLAFWGGGSHNIQESVLALLGQPLTWCVAVSWLLAAITVQLFCLRQNRLLAGGGVMIATIILIAGLCVGGWIGSDQVAWFPEISVFISTIGAGVVMAAICMLGMPVPDEEEI